MTPRLRQLIRHYHQTGRRIVFTNGCFDIIHAGHVTYLSKAKKLGDILIVGLNSDDSIQRLKGPARPINRLEDRLQVLSALSSVDLVIPFHEDTPSRLISEIRPHLYVKGGDYQIHDLIEAPIVRQLGGQIIILPFTPGRSTTKLIQRIKGVTS